MQKKLSPALAQIELAVLGSEADAVSSSDIFAWLNSQGLPDEVAIRLKELANLTGRVGARLIKVGKIVLVRIIEFVKAHPNMAIGLAIGAVVGAFIISVPVLGPVLAAISVLFGAIAGHNLDVGRRSETELVSITQDAIEVARVFLVNVIALFNDLLEDGCFEPL